jgi:predicted ATPase
VTQPNCLFKSIRLTEFLSFGQNSDTLPLGPLNVMIGPNGSGKSNTIEAFALLQAAPRDLLTPIREGGGVRDWLWKPGGSGAAATIDVVTANGRIPQAPRDMGVRYLLSFAEEGRRFAVADERIENEFPFTGYEQPFLYYGYQKGRPVLNVRTMGVPQPRKLQHEQIDPEQSILSQRRDPEQYPEVTGVGALLGRIRIYRDWSFGRYTPPRLQQKADMPNDLLEADASNLGLVLNRLRRDPAVKTKLLEQLASLYGDFTDFDVSIEAGSVQVFLTEGRFTIPATRLSDGTLRYLCLLAILCHPAPGPLICIEEPELGLHPDVLPNLAELLVDASSRTQLMVTTHSDILVDALSHIPECIIVCEKEQGATSLRRLDQVGLAPWLDKYRLGELWTRGEIGGTRW